MAEFPRALPHGPVVEIFPDVFLVTGRFRAGPGATIPRNMVVVRRGSDLIVVNSVRLTEEGEAALAKLGTVVDVIRLGAFHGADDPYYAARYGVPAWAPAGTRFATPIADTRALSAESHPVDRARVVVLSGGKLPEAALLLEGEGGVLVTCDSFQHWTSYDGASLLARAFLRIKGFGPNLIGPMWLDAMGKAVLPELEQMAALDFRHAVPAHGAVLRDKAPEGLRAAIAKARAKG